jgi:hypothetical protein
MASKYLQQLAEQSEDQNSGTGMPVPAVDPLSGNPRKQRQLIEAGRTAAAETVARQIDAGIDGSGVDTGPNGYFARGHAAVGEAKMARRNYEEFVNSQEYTDWEAAETERYWQEHPANTNYWDPLQSLDTIEEQDALQQFLEENPHPKEEQLRENMEQADREATAFREEQMMRNDLRQFSTWSKEEQDMLIAYAIDRDNELLAGQEAWMNDAQQNVMPLVEKYGWGTVNNIAESYMRYESQNLNRDIAQWAQQEVEGNAGAAVGHSLLSVGANLIGSLTSPAGFLQDATWRTGRYSTLNPYNAGQAMNSYSGAVRGQVAQDIAGEDPTWLSTAASWGYQGIMSGADSIARILATGGDATAALGLAGLGSFGQAMSEASAAGATPAQAVIYSTGIAGLEVLTEKMPLDSLLDLVGGSPNRVEAIIRNLGEELTGEEISLLGGLLWEAAVLQDSAAYNQRVQELTDSGMTEAQAREVANNEVIREVLSTAVATAVSVGASSGAAIGGNMLMNAANNRTQPQQQPQAAQTQQAGTDAATEGKEAPDLAQSMAEGMAMAYPMEQEAQQGQTPEQVQMDAAIRETVGVEEQSTADGDTNAVSQPLNSYPAEKQNTIRSYIRSVDEKIKSFVRRVKSGDLTFRREKISDVSARAAADIRGILGIDASGYTHNINTNGVQHIIIRHGENGEHDHSMAIDDDIARVGWVLENYDYVEPLTENGEQVYSAEFNDSNNERAPQIRFVKKIDGSYYVVEAACENKYKKLWVQSARLQKNGDVTQASAEGQEANHETNARSALASPSPTYTVSEDGAKVNGNSSEDTPMDHGAVGAAERDHDYGRNTVGSAQSKFKHEVRRSKVYDNTYANATGEGTRKVGKTAEALDPHMAEYDYVSEKESVHNALERVGKKGGEHGDLYEIADEEVDAEYEYLIGKEGWTGEDNDTAMIVLNRLQKNGDVERFKALAKQQRHQGTTGGQFIQSFAKYTRDATTASVEAVERLDSMDKADVSRRFYKGKDFDQWKQDVGKQILGIANEIENVEDGDVDGMRNIVRQLANFRRTTAWAGNSSNLTKAAERMVGKLDFDTAKDIAVAQLSMIPEDFRKRTKGERIKTFRIQNMLSGLTTVNRNLVGNAVGGVMDAVSDSTTGRFADWLMSQFTGKRTVGNDVKYAKEYFKAAKDAADMASLCVELDIPMEREAAYSTGKTRSYSPQSGPVGRFLSAYEKYLKYALEVTDKFFEGGTSGAVSESLRELGAAANLKADEIDALAQKAGERRTFKEGRKLAKMNTSLKNAMNQIGTEDFGLGDAMIPFAGVPGDVTQTGVDYSGMGIIEGLVEIAGVIKDVRAGREVDVLRQRKAAADFGRGVTGVGLIATFTALAAAGIIGVHDDPDKDERGLEQSLGLSGAQFNIDAMLRMLKGESTQWREDDVVISIDFLEPFNSQMYIGYLLSQEDSLQEMAAAWPGAAFQGIVQSVLDMPMMQTMSDIANIGSSMTEVAEDGNFDAVWDAVGQFGGNMLSGFVPSWLRQTAQYVDPYYRDTSAEDPIQKMINQVMATIPGLSTMLPKKYDGLGNAQRRYDDPLMGFFSTFVSPGKIGQVKTDAIVDGLNELSDLTGNDSIFPEYMAPNSFTVNGERVEISGKDMTETYQMTYGDTIAGLYGEIMESPDFAVLPPELQVEVLTTAKGYATEAARASVSDYEMSWSGKYSDVANDIIAQAVTGEFNDAFSGMTASWRNGESAEESVDALWEAYRVFDDLDEDTQKAILEASSGRLTAYFTAREAGIDTETFAEYYGIYYEIGQQEEDEGRQATLWAHELQKAVEAGELTREEADILQESMKYWYQVPATAENRYDAMVDSGISADDALDLGYLLDGVEGTGSYDEEKGENRVRDIDRLECIAGFDGLTESEKILVMQMYMNEGQIDKMETIMSTFGLDSEEYAAVYRAYLDGDNKAEEIAGLRELGYSQSEAERIYRIYHPTS